MVFWSDSTALAMDAAFESACLGAAAFFLLRCAAMAWRRIGRADRASWRIATQVEGAGAASRLRSRFALGLAVVGPEVLGQAVLAAILLAAPDMFRQEIDSRLAPYAQASMGCLVAGCRRFPCIGAPAFARAGPAPPDLKASPGRLPPCLAEPARPAAPAPK